MKKKARFCFLFFFLWIFLFTACDGEVEINLYTSDLTDAMDSSETITTPVSVIVEGMSETYDYAFLQRLIPSFSNPHYVEYDYQTSLAFDMRVPIINSKNLSSFSKNDFLFLIVGEETKAGYSYFIDINNSMVKDIDAYTSSNMYSSFKLQDFKYSYNIINDQKETYNCTLYSCYINNEAVPGSLDITVQRRDSYHVKMSEVMSKSLAQPKKNYFISVLKK